MKRIFYLISVALLAFAFTSCEEEPLTPDNPNDDQEQNDNDEDDEDDVKNVTATFSFPIPAELNIYEPSFGIQLLQLKEINTGNVITPIKAETRVVAGLNVTVSLPEGAYALDMEAIARYEINGSVKVTNLRAHAESITITAATSNVPYVIESSVYNAAANSGFVIAEIFFTGTETPEGKQYNGDKYIRIYNNSDETLCADGLAIAESEFLTVEKNDYTPNVMNEAFTAGAIYRIPVGSNIMVKPGEDILLVDIAINHKDANANSFDLSKADFEWYDESSNPKFTDTDNPDVPNMERIYTYSATVWGPHNRGYKSFVLCRLGEDEANQLDKETYLNDYYYEYTYNFIFDGSAYPMDGSAYKIPNSWILDAVNLSVESEFQWIVTSPALDKSYTYCGHVDGDKSRYGKTVRRKLLMGTTLQDTNDSAVDFLAEQDADPFFKLHD